MPSRLFLVLLIASISLQSCTTYREGVTGRITEISGNHMPGPGVKLPDPEPLKTTVLITIALGLDELVKNEEGLYVRPHDKVIVKEVQTDANGNYKAHLDPGIYSVLVKTKDGWFANQTSEAGILNELTILAKELVTRNITVNYRAAF